MLKYSENPVPRQIQDSKRGWLCIFGVSLVFIFNVSLIPTFPMLLEPFFAAQNENAATVLNLFNFLTNLTILATGFLLKDLSARHFVVIGSTVTFVGLLLTAFVTSLVQLIFTFSILVAVGLGFLNPAAFVAVLSCFTTQRIYAISVVFAALGLGQMIMPIIVKTLLVDFGMQTAIFALTGFSVLGIAGSSFLVPIKWKPKIQIDDESEPLIIRKSFRRRPIVKEIIGATDLDLLWNYKYFTIIFGLSVVFASSSNFNIIFPVYLQNRVNLDLTQVENCIFSIAVSDITSRVAYPLILNVVKFSSRFMFVIGVLGLTVVRIILLVMDLENYKLLLIVCAAMGFFRALTVVNQVVVLCDFCEDNCPKKLPEDFGRYMRVYVAPEEIVSIRQIKTNYVVEFASTAAAFSILSTFNGKFIGANVLSTEWKSNVTSFADFDFELRCICLANYWNPPIFVYGRIIPITKVQLVSVIVKNNRKNQFTTFLLEMNYEGLVDIHSRVCEVLVLYVMEAKELPKQNLIFKCSKEHALLVGVVTDMSQAMITPSTLIINKQIYMYLDEISELRKISYLLIASQMLDEIYAEYKMILKEKNLFHQFIGGISSEGNLLGCIDPAYRLGKPMKYQLDSRQMILALCDQESLSNINQRCLPVLHSIPKLDAPKHFKVDKIQLIPLVNVQREDVHFTYRPFVEFNQVDSFSSLKQVVNVLGHEEPALPPFPFSVQPFHPRLGVFEAFRDYPGQPAGNNSDPFDFDDFFGTLPM